MKSVAVVLLKGTEIIYEESLKDVIEAAVNFYYDEAEISVKKLIPPPEAFNKERRQYDAEKIVSFLNNQESIKKYDIVISLIDEDIYYGDMQFVFGLTGVKSGRLVVSTYRLKYDYSMLKSTSIDTFKERFFKELLHELGHANGLTHCPNKLCVMSFSSTLKEVDEKLPMLCELCRRKLESLKK